MRGHPHPPLNAWYLALLLAVFRDVSEVPLHAAYILFSLIAGFSALWLARGFSPHPLAATLLFLVTPAFVINGSSFESDLPFVAFWLLSIALFVAAVDRHSTRLLVLSSLAMALAALSAYQAVLLVPILLLYGRRYRASWAAALTPAVLLLAWQLYERLSSGSMPASVLAGYMQTYGFQALDQKLKSAVCVNRSLGLDSISERLATAAACDSCRDRGGVLRFESIVLGFDRDRSWHSHLVRAQLAGFSSAVGPDLFCWRAGHLLCRVARYLLPIALPLAILATRRTKLFWTKVAFGGGLALSLTLAVVNINTGTAIVSLLVTLRAKRNRSACGSTASGD